MARAPRFSFAFASPSVVVAPVIRPVLCMAEVRRSMLDAGREQAEKDCAEMSASLARQEARAWKDVYVHCNGIGITTEEAAARVRKEYEARTTADYLADKPMSWLADLWGEAQEMSKEVRKNGYCNWEDFVNLPENIRYADCECQRCHAAREAYWAAHRAEDKRMGYGKNRIRPRFYPNHPVNDEAPSKLEAYGEAGADW